MKKKLIKDLSIVKVVKIVKIVKNCPKKNQEEKEYPSGQGNVSALAKFELKVVFNGRLFRRKRASSSAHFK